MLFTAYGLDDIDVVCKMIAQTAVWSADTIKRLLYVTMQHSATVRTQTEALQVLAQYMAVSNKNGPVTPAAVEDLLHANVLPHLATPQSKMMYLAHISFPLISYDPWERLGWCAVERRISITALHDYVM